MITIPRRLGGVLRLGAWSAIFLTLGVRAFGQAEAPANPLRPSKAIAENNNVESRPAEPASPLVSPTEPVRTRLARETAVRPAAYGFAAPARQPASRQPASRRPHGYPLSRNVAVGTSLVGEAAPKPTPAAPLPPKPSAPSPTAEGGTVPQPVEGEIIYQGPYEELPGDAFMDTDMGMAGAVEGCGEMGCVDCCLIPCPLMALKYTEVFAGVHGFTGPTNRGETGSFGFHEGFNWGLPVPCTCGGVGAQFGLRAVHSNFSGAEFSDETRNQIFLTGGVFRRVDWGLQGGCVVDYLSEDWYASTDLVQLRGELSWVFPCTHELGFWLTQGTNSDVQTSRFSGSTPATLETWEPTDLYAFFYRRRFDMCEDATARIYAGFTGDSDGLIGADLSLPLSESLALRSGFTYLVPQEGTGSAGRGHEQEAWNVGLTLVWYPGCLGKCTPNYFRPMFDVAGNGTFILDRQ